MEKLLVIDDDRDIRMLIKHSLENEYEVVTSEVLGDNLYPLNQYDLIILDVMLKDADGFDICINIRDQVDCPILFLTAKFTDDDLEYGFSIGADDYLKKPFSVAELRARAKAHLRREKRVHQSLLVRGDYRFDLKSKEASFGKNPLNLTSSEYDILLLLAKNPGQVFSKEEIYENIYGYDKDGNESAIAEHVKNIRKKIGQDDSIETVWGIGYRWKKRS